MENIQISELTRDESFNLKGGFANVPSPSDSAPSFYNGNCASESGFINGNCSCTQECTNKEETTTNPGN